MHRSSHFCIKPASRFRFHGNKSHLSASKCLQQLHIVYDVDVVGYVEISMLQQFLVYMTERAYNDVCSSRATFVFN